MDFEITWTEAASADLESIVDNLAQSSPDRAEKTANAILNHVEVLRTFPRIGPRYAKDPRRQVREVLCGKYRIFYRLNEPMKLVEILTVWHGARQEPDLPF
jgi:plasmid stabilization system protein ParE